MPLLSAHFHRPAYLFNGHLETIVPALRRKLPPLYTERERLTLADGDFLDLDWVRRGHPNLVILTHGLEGDSHRHYMLGMARYFAERHWDVLAWNCRSCSGVLNQAPRLYHHGGIDDIEELIQHVIAQYNYQKIGLVGFSMGGSITLKYLGVKGKNAPAEICGGVALSAPCDLAAGAACLEERQNRIYRRRFRRMLEDKIRRKVAQHPGLIDLTQFERIKRWRDFDEFFSAPLNGYASADNFYEQSSAKNFMGGTDRPLLVVNAQNDPLLMPACTPVDMARKHPMIFTEWTAYGGHVGFTERGQRHTYAERRAFQFLNEI